MNTSGMDSWEVAYLRKVIAETGLSGNAIARAAGVSASTINRPVNDPDWHGRINPATLDKVARATGVDYRPFATAGFSDARPAFAPAIPARQGSIQVSVDGDIAQVSATITLDMIPELRRKIDLIEALLRG